MELKEIDYQKIQEVIDSKSKEIFINIFNEYFRYISNDKDKVRDLEDKEKMHLDEENNLVSVGRIIVVDRPNDTDINDFGGIKNVPTGHGGRHKRDNLIHIYPYSQKFEEVGVSTLEEMLRFLISEIVVHEVFHFYVQPDVYKGTEEETDIDNFFKAQLTEGIIQTLTNKYMEEHNLGKTRTGYVEELLLVSNIINDLKEQKYTEEQIIYILLNDNYKELINRCKNGENIRNSYIERSMIRKKVIDLLKNLFKNNKKLLFDLVNHLDKFISMEEKYKELVNIISTYGFDKSYLIEIDNIFGYNKEEKENNKK